MTEPPTNDEATEAAARELQRVEIECNNDPEFLLSLIGELRALWKATLEREGNLASAVADVVWKAAQFGETEDGDTFAYIVPKGAMHRLVGVAQSNGAHVPVSFRAFIEPTP